MNKFLNKFFYEKLFLIILFTSYPILVGLSLLSGIENFFFSLLRYSLLLFSILLIFFVSYKKNVSFEHIFFTSLLIFFSISILQNYTYFNFIIFIISIFIPFFFSNYFENKFDINFIKYLTLILFFNIIIYLIIYIYINNSVLYTILFEIKDETIRTDTSNYFYHNGFRIGSVSLNPISFANYLAVVILGLLTVFKNQKNIIFIYFIILMIFLNTGSRGPFISLILTIIIGQKLFKTPFSIFISVLIFCLITQFASSEFVDQSRDTISRFYNSFISHESGNYDKSASDRVSNYKCLLDDCSPTVVETNFYHNLLLETYSIGYLYFFLFCIMIASPFYYLYKKINFILNDKVSIYFYLIFIYFLIESMFSGFMPREEFLFFSSAMIFNRLRTLKIN
ncbi:hypothetical protein IDH04_00260 [Pelagibacterales bacterium SAG-MED10]|nr:hypothetical protein [Pelagibacterales bacterium SAG-MED10]